MSDERTDDPVKESPKGTATTESATEAKTEAPADAVAEAKTEAPADAVAEAVPEAKAEAPAEAVAEAKAEAPAEAVAEAKAEAPAEVEARAETPTETDAAATTRQDGTDLAVVPPPPPRRKVTVQIAGLTDVGRIREHNEDNLLVADLSTRGRDAALFDTTLEVGERGVVLAVCDGMGGALAGEIASQMAVDVIHSIVQEAGGAKDGDHFAQKLVGAVQEAGARIYLAAKTNRNQHGMGTTATVAGVYDGQVFVGQVGDSRAYVMRQGRLRQITKDQSLVSKLIEAGQLTEDEAESYEHAHIILQALGTSDAVCVDLSFVDLRKGDVLMLCSDGLSGLATNEQIHEILSSGDAPLRCAQRLTDAANDAGGHDNITVVVARFDGELPEPGEDDALQGYQAHVLSKPVEALVAGRASTTMKVPDLPPPGSDLKNRISIPPEAHALPKYDDLGDDDDAEVAESRSRVTTRPPSRGSAADDAQVSVPMDATPWGRVVIAAVVLGVILGAWLALRGDPTPPPRPPLAPAGTVERSAPETAIDTAHPVAPTPLPAPAWGDAAVGGAD